MRRRGDQNPAASAVTAHRNRFRCRRCPVIDRRVGDVHTGQLTDHRLVLEDRLQNPLADFRLIGGIGGDKLFFGGHAFNDRGDIVVVGARAAEDHREHPVFRSE